MKKMYAFLASVAFCLWGCSSGKDRNVPVAKNGTCTGSKVISNGKAQLTTAPIIIVTGHFKTSHSWAVQNQPLFLCD